jgi:hypothetical protein
MLAQSEPARANLGGTTRTPSRPIICGREIFIYIYVVATKQAYIWLRIVSGENTAFAMTCNLEALC